MNDVALLINDIIAAFAKGHIEPVNITVADEILDRCNEWLYDYMGMEESDTDKNDFSRLLDDIYFSEEVLF